MIRTVIVDDEHGAIETLKALIEDICPELLVVGEATTINSAKQLIGNLKPDLVFLDINMPNGSGLEIVKQINPFPSKVIFTTAFQEYAIQAIRLSAVDYLLKPIDEGELLLAVNRFKRINQSVDSLNILNEILQHREVQRIAIAGTNDIQVVRIQDITHICSDKNYSTFHLVNGDKVVASKPLNVYESLLENHGFFRINRSALVHLTYVKRYVRGRGGQVTLLNGETLEVARTRKKILLETLGD